MNGSTVSKAGESSEWLSCGFKHILPEGGGWDGRKGRVVPAQTLEDSRESLAAGRHGLAEYTTRSILLLCSHCTLKQMISLFFGGRGGEQQVNL